MGTTPEEIKAFVKQAWQDIQTEFAACLGEGLDAATLKKLKEIFDRTVRNAIENYGVAWEEPIRSYALRHVCMIAKRARRCTPCDGSIAEGLDAAADTVFDEAHKTCQRLAAHRGWAGDAGRAGKIGVLCGKG